MTRIMLLVCIGISSVGLLLLTGCGSTSVSVGGGTSGGGVAVAKTGPPAHAPAHGYRAKHTYWYYPDARVYREEARGLYWYLEAGDWKVSASLPASLNVHLGDHVTIEMDSDEPYSEHAAHCAKYPPGQQKKQKQKGGKGKH